MEAVDKMLTELIDLERDVRLKSKRIEAIKSWCKEQGSFSTQFHVCSIKEHTRVGLVGLEKVANAIGRDILEDLDLINISQFSTVHVSRKSPTEFDIAL